MIGRRTASVGRLLEKDAVRALGADGRWGGPGTSYVEPRTRRPWNSEYQCCLRDRTVVVEQTAGQCKAATDTRREV